MAVPIGNKKKIEKERRAAYARLVKRYKKDKGDPVDLQEYSQSTVYAAMHVASIHMEMVAQNLLEDPEIISDPKAYALAYKAHINLYNLYQRMGELWK